MTYSSYRLDPRFPLVWRTPSSLQIGVDHALARFDAVSAADETLLHALRVGVGFEGLRMLADEATADAGAVTRVLERVRPALDSARASPFAGADIVVEGDSPAATALRRLFAQLLAHGGTVGGGTVGGGTVGGDTVAGGGTVGGDTVAGGGTVGGGVGDGARPDLAVLVAAWAVRPADAARWLRQDVAHVAVVFSDQEARIGPLVTPGRGPCLHCVERTAISRDAAWPAMASQLLGRRAPTEEPLLIASVSAITARLVRGFLARDGRGLRPGAVVHVNAASGAVTETVRLVHPECACQALPENATEHGPEPWLNLSQPTRAPAVAAHE